MTVPIQEYVAVAAREACLKLIERRDSGEADERGDIVSCRERGFLLIVARGEFADDLEKAFKANAVRVDDGAGT